MVNGDPVVQAEVAGLAEDVVCEDRPGCQDTARQ